jgi:hypothetical protein
MERYIWFYIHITLTLYALVLSLCDKVCQLLAAGLWFSPGTVLSLCDKVCQLLVAGLWFSPGTVLSL